MFAVDFCGCYTFDREFFSTWWLYEATLKRWYNPKVVADFTYSVRPMWAFVPRRAGSSPYCTRPG